MTVVIVLGMHRSGTSLVASILDRWGVNMGSSFLETDDVNPNGYFEDVEFLGINKHILAKLGGDWRTQFIRKQVLSVDAETKLKMFILAKTRQEQNKQKMWGWKDPRNCQTCWLWHPHLDNPRYIVIQRDLTDVVKSLMSVHKGKQAKWENLSRHYRNQIRKFLEKEKPVCFTVQFEDFFDQETVGPTLVNMAAFLGLSRRKAMTGASRIRKR